MLLIQRMAVLDPYYSQYCLWWCGFMCNNNIDVVIVVVMAILIIFIVIIILVNIIKLCTMLNASNNISGYVCQLSKK